MAGFIVAEGNSKIQGIVGGYVWRLTGMRALECLGWCLRGTSNAKLGLVRVVVVGVVLELARQHKRLQVVSGVWRSEDTRRICLGSRNQDFEGDSGHATPV
jgi:hypothetical protein